MNKIGFDDYLVNSDKKHFQQLPVIEVQSLGERINEATVSDYKTILQVIDNVKNKIEREALCNKLAKRLGVKLSTIEGELRDLQKAKTKNTEAEGNVLLVHPVYDVQPDFLSLGFSVTKIVGAIVEDINLQLIATDTEYLLFENSELIKLPGLNLIVQEKATKRPDINARWSFEKMSEFRENPYEVTGLYLRIKDAIKEHVELQKEAQYGLLAAWVIATYFHRLFHAFPFLFLFGKKQSGKSRLLEQLERLCFNAVKTKITTVPTLAYTLDVLRGTFLLDQAEALSNPQNREFLGYIADGYTIGGGKKTSLQPTKNGWHVVEFETYSPKAFASTKKIDADILDRCIQFVLVRATKDYPYPEPHLEIWKELRDDLYRLLLTKWETVRAIYLSTGKDTIQRVRELWRPIETILALENVPEEEQHAIKNAFLDSMIETQTELSDREEKLFQTLLANIPESDPDRTFSVQQLADAMYSNFNNFEEKEKRGTVTWIGNRISQLNLAMENLGRKSSRSTYRFNRSHIQEMYDRHTKTGRAGSPLAVEPRIQAPPPSLPPDPQGRVEVVPAIVDTTSAPPRKLNVARIKSLKLNIKGDITTSATINRPIPRVKTKARK